MSSSLPASHPRGRREQRSGRSRGTPLIVVITAAALVGAFLVERHEANPVGALSEPARGAGAVSANAWQVYFSPDGGCTDAIVSALDGAKSTVRVQAYSFTSARIAKALVAAARRGVDVQVILDKSQRGERYSSADFLANAGVPLLIDAAHAIAHDKVMVIDAETVITGSFNFTGAAETRNSENVLILKSVEIAQRYGANWEVHRQHAEPFAGKSAQSNAPLAQ
jgi:phosphatidylserine/phosphatidylglycerophosphate/cardiolipin synthase-like enzyme